MVDIRALPLLCLDHRKKVARWYGGTEAEERKQAEIEAIVNDAEACPRCGRARRLARERKEQEGWKGRPPSWQGASLVECWPDDAIEFYSFPAHRRRELKTVGLSPPGKLTRDVRAALRAIPSGSPELHPASTTLADGTSLPRVYFVEEKYAIRTYVGFWTHFVRPSNITSVRPSAFQMPASIAKQLFAVGETSMGGLEFRITLRDGERFACFFSGASDFIELPTPRQPSDIIGVEVNRGLASNKDSYLTEPDFVWCVYR